MTLQPPRPVFHHTAAKERILSPDIARGLMLLSIVVANATTAWWMYSSTGMPTTRLSGADRVVTVLNDVAVHSRGLLMFATLFGFGLGMLAMRESKRGTPWPQCRSLMLKRYSWLALFGVIHAIFLFFGDILITYALLGYLLILLVPLRDKTLLWIAAAVAALNIGFMALTHLFSKVMETLMTIGAAGAGGAVGVGGAADPMMMPIGGDSYFTGQVLIGLIIVVTSPLTAVIAGMMLFPVMIIGFVAARRGILHNAEQHKRLLTIVAIVGCSAALAAGIPLGITTETTTPLYTDAVTSVWSQLSELAGMLAGPGIIAALALALIPVQKRIKAEAQQGRVAHPPFPLDMLQALGQRSMTGYVGQSVLLLPLASAWGADIFADATLWQVSLYSSGVWFVTLVFAYALAKTDKPGPLEAIHRRLTYGKGDNAVN